MAAPQWPYIEDGLAKVNRYANLLPFKPHRDYAFAYISYRRKGSTGPEPKRGRLRKFDAINIEDDLERIAIYGV